MPYELKYITERIRADAPGFVRECEAAYAEKVALAAREIAENRARSPIVLLSGPSGSGKTTTAKRLRDALKILGVTAHTVSLDNYFHSPRQPDAPRTPEGELDFESPECIDWPLLSEHFTALSRGGEVCIPRFSFSAQTRTVDRSSPMCLGRDEVAIFEGIHALSDRITALHPNAYRLYISARSNIERDGALFFKGTWVRLTRRAIRDAQFRGADAQFTLSLWRNVRRGEKAHISPFKDTASLRLDTLIPYEISLMRGDALRIFSAVPPDFTGFGELHALIAALTEFPPLDASLAPPDSMLREFIGGGIYEY